ncbi:hypothetical protein [Pseudogemmobacter sonorensis]|uniref:hypothetical protein n=1 Tax=Pseudogemmobacter sonorensis TaxID=2989681 RepID=UPI0036881E89
MANVRGMLARVRRLEVARSTASPIARLYGSFEAFAEEVQADIDAGKLDRTDMPVVLDCLRRWEREKVWSQWQNTGHRVMAQSL